MSNTPIIDSIINKMNEKGIKNNVNHKVKGLYIIKGGNYGR